MIVRCSACLLKFDDEFRSTVCSHEPFPANDGTNNFVIHYEAVLIPPRTIPPEKVLKHLQILLSFDRPAAKERIVNECRDFLLVCGYPVDNDFRHRRDGYYTLITQELRDALCRQ